MPLVPFKGILRQKGEKKLQSTKFCYFQDDSPDAESPLDGVQTQFRFQARPQTGPPWSWPHGCGGVQQPPVSRAEWDHGAEVTRGHRH